MGEADEPGLGRGLGGRARGAVLRVALDLDVEPVGKQPGQPLGQRAGAGGVIVAQQRAERAVGAPGQADQALGVGGERVEGDVRRGGGAVEIVGAGQLHQVGEAGLGLGEQHDRARPGGAVSGMRRGGVGEVELAAEDRLDPGLGGGLRELQRGEEVAGVGQRHGGLAGGPGEFRQRLDLDRALEERVGRVDAQVDELGSVHRGRVAAPAGLSNDPAARRGAVARRVNEIVGSGSILSATRYTRSGPGS